MKKEVRNALRIGFPFIITMVLVLSTAFPVLADNKTKPVPVLRTVQGEVVSVASDNATSDNATIVIQSGNQLQVNIKVDANTRYFMVPVGKASAAVSATVEVQTAEKKANKGQSKKLQVAESTETAFTANCDNGADWWNGKKAQLSDIQVGDRIIARVKTADNLATQILIIKPPAIQKVKGIITAVSDNSTITITPSTSIPVTLSWDGNTRFVLKGLISIQSGQYASAVYNKSTMIIMNMDVQANAPAPEANPDN